MMSLSTVSSGAAASGYYKTEGYYIAGSPEAEQSALWFGKGAEAAELTGPVDDAKFTEILEGHTPDGTKTMGRIVEGERQHRPGLDLTFSAPKSVSVAGLVMGDQRVINAHDEAVREVMGYVEQNVVQTRYYANGELVTQTGGDIIAGVFRHDTSRALDPQLHSHAVVANMVKNEAGGFTALHNEEIYKQSAMLKQMYWASLHNKVKSLGIEVTKEPNGSFELSNMPDAVTAGFSKRRQQILDSLKEKGLEPTPENAQLAALYTRAAKATGYDREELKTAWKEEGRQLGLTPELTQKITGVTKEGVELPPRLGGQVRDDPANAGALGATQVALAQAIEHLSERQSVYNRSDLAATTLRFSKHPSFELTQSVIAQALVKKELFASGENADRITDKASVAREVQIKDVFREGQKSEGVILEGATFGKREITGEQKLSRQVSETTLTSGQQDAIKASLSEGGRYVGVQGSAGTGKTYMLEKLAHYAKMNNYEVQGYAPSHQAVDELSSALPGSKTLASVLAAERHHSHEPYNKDADNSNKILVVDEASMVSSRDMVTLMEHATRTNAARVVLVGDQQQLDAVGAGSPFAQLQKEGMPTAIMDDIQRQRSAPLKDAVLHAIAGEVKNAFAKIGDNVEEHEHYTKAAADAWLKLDPAERDQTRIATLTNLERDHLNKEIRSSLRTEGALKGADVKISGLAPLHFTAAEAGDAQSYKEGDVIQALRNSQKDGLTKGRLYEVTDTRRVDNTIALRPTDGSGETRIALNPNGRGATSTLVHYERETRNMAVGDQIRFRITDKEADVINGVRGEITAIDKDTTTFKLTDGTSREVANDSLVMRGAEHNYAATTHALQGATVDKIIGVMGSTTPGTTQKAFYVQISRARDEAKLFTDDATELATRIETNTGVRPDALTAMNNAANAATFAKDAPEVLHAERGFETVNTARPITVQNELDFGASKTPHDSPNDGNPRVIKNTPDSTFDGTKSRSLEAHENTQREDQKDTQKDSQKDGQRDLQDQVQKEAQNGADKDSKSPALTDAEIREKLAQEPLTQTERDHLKDLTREIEKDMSRMKEKQIER